MGEQMAYRYLRRDIVVRVVGEVLAEGSGQIDFAFSGESQDSSGGEHLVHRAEAELSAVVLAVCLARSGVAVRFFEKDLVTSSDQNRARKIILRRRLSGLVSRALRASPSESRAASG